MPELCHLAEKVRASKMPRLLKAYRNLPQSGAKNERKRRPTLKHSSRFRGELRPTDQMIDNFDILIASTAIQHHLTLVALQYERLCSYPQP